MQVKYPCFLELPWNYIKPLLHCSLNLWSIISWCDIVLLPGSLCISAGKNINYPPVSLFGGFPNNKYPILIKNIRKTPNMYSKQIKKIPFASAMNVGMRLSPFFRVYHLSISWTPGPVYKTSKSKRNFRVIPIARHPWHLYVFDVNFLWRVRPEPGSGSQATRKPRIWCQMPMIPKNGTRPWWPRIPRADCR